jgi:uncharacterized protein with FMN-binding domain
VAGVTAAIATSQIAIRVPVERGRIEMMSVVAHDEGSVTIDRYSSTVYCSVAE